MPTAQAEDRRPVHEIRHRNIRATIWKNETAKGPMYNVTVSRSYRDESGEWHDVNSIRLRRPDESRQGLVRRP